MFFTVSLSDLPIRMLVVVIVVLMGGGGGGEKEVRGHKPHHPHRMYDR